MGRKSLRFKLIIVLLIATIAPIVTSMIVTNAYTKHSVKERTIQENTNLLSQSKLNLVNYMDQLIDLSFSMYKNPSFIQLTALGFTGYQSEAELKNLVRSVGSHRDVYQVYLNILERGPGESLSYLLFNRDLKENAEVTMPPNPLLKQGTYEAAVETTHPSHSYGILPFSYYAPREVMTIHRAIYEVPSMKRIGNLSIDFKLDSLGQLVRQLLNEGEAVYLIDSTGAVIYTSAPGVEAGHRLNEPWVNRLLSSSPSQGSLEEDKSLHMFEKVETSYMNWYLVKKIPYDRLYRGATELTQIQLLILGCLLIVIVALTLWISVRFTRPIKELIGYINVIQTGQLSVDIQVTTDDEIGILARRFRLMMETINGLITREYKLGLANKTNQLKALQAQINPHFLYNSLQSIGTLALQHEAPRIYKLISALAKMMRYSMNTNDFMVPLKKELEHVKSYLELQQQRFEDELTVRYHIEEGTLGRPLPKMTLQPLVENYFKHGFDPRENPGELDIRCQLNPDGGLVLVVEDNGRGMTDGDLEALQARLDQSAYDSSEPEQPDESIGLLNVKTRLELNFGPDSRVIAEHGESGGLRIMIIIPDEPVVGGTAD